MNYASVGRFTTYKAKKMLEVLRKHVHHIHWELGWADGYLSDVSKYSDICVPEFQFDEADYVISRLENGEDLYGYRPDSRFPVLFAEEDGNFQVVKPLTAFAENVQELINCLEAPSGDDLIAYLRKISRLLINIYILQYDLPDCAGDSYYQPSLGFILPNKLDPFSVYYEVSDPFTGQVNIQYLEKTLEDILEVLQTGIVHYDMYQETGNYQYLSIAASVWKNQFSGEYGWGTGVVNAQKVIHYAGMYLQKGRLPKPESR